MSELNSPELMISIKPPDGARMLSGLEENGVQSDSAMTVVKRMETPHIMGVSRGARLHIAPGAYPVYYSLARANGRFGKYIRALTRAEIEKYNII